MDWLDTLVLMDRIISNMTLEDKVNLYRLYYEDSQKYIEEFEKRKYEVMKEMKKDRCCETKNKNSICKKELELIDQAINTILYSDIPVGPVREYIYNVLAQEKERLKKDNEED